ncbi:alpha/beta fold hydrolase [Microlunatus sp. GCM10028923]|uniref:alpha/beta fold hydrolase n=1 Tax=Microlunatus sp. GCM10028923 TaxID=3273400 RepID=UPI00361474A0
MAKPRPQPTPRPRPTPRRPPTPSADPARRAATPPARSGIGVGEGLGLLAGFAALAAGGIAAGLELERRFVSKRIHRRSDRADEEFFGLRSDGPILTTADGVLLHTEIDEPDTDDPDRPTLVFVHGYALSLDCWHFQRKYFRGRYRQIFYDQRSHGRSGRSDPERCRIPQLADDLAAVLDELAGDRPVILIGHSMGGMTIMHLAQTRPEWFGSRVRGVALFATSAGEMADHSPIRALPGRAFSRIAQPLMATLNRIPELVEKGRQAGSDIGYVVTRRMAFGSADPPVAWIEFVSEMLGRTPLEVVADFYPAFAELDEYEALRVLRGIPTAVVGGLDDVITPIEHTDKIIALLPDAESHRLERCGHLGIIDRHSEINPVLDRLIARAQQEPVIDQGRALDQDRAGDQEPGR